jgi:ABC-type uncharacterized transport system permease subunit
MSAPAVDTAGVAAETHPPRVREGVRAVLLALVPLALALLVAALILLVLGRDPVAFYVNIVKRGLLSWAGLQETIIRMAPLLLLAASLIVAFRAGVWNLGIDGQFMLAAVMVAASGPTLTSALPGGLGLLVLYVLAAAVGAVWALIPALLRAYYGVNEIITTLMMTFIGTSLSALLVKTVFNDPTTTVPQTVVLPVEDRLPRMFGTHIHSGVLVGLALILLVHFVMTRTSFGLKAQVIGHNPRAALHVGLNVPRLTVAVFALSAGLAGMAGGTEILGVFGLVQNEWNPAYGLLIVPLVFLARFHGVAAIGFVAFFAMLSIGGETASRKANLPNFFLLVIVALLLVFMALAEYLDVRWRRTGR